MTDEEAMEELATIRAFGADIALQIIDGTPGPAKARMIVAFAIANLLFYENNDEKQVLYLHKLMKEVAIFLRELEEREKDDDE